MLNDAGQVAFVADLSGSGVDSSNDFGIWRSGPESLSLVAREGSPTPGTASGVNFSSLSSPVLNDAGQVAFFSFLTGSGVDSSNNGGIWRGAPGSLSLVARKGSQAPGTASGVDFARLDEPVLNDAGQVAFAANLTGSGVDSSNNQGIWRGAPGSLSLAARTGSQASGTASGVNFSFFNSPVLNDAGQVAFFSRLSGSGVDSSNNEGIWRGAPGSLSLVARAGSPAPGTAAGVNFFGLGSPVLNDAGQVAFFAGLTGSGVDANNDRGIWIGDGSESLLAARKGDLLAGRTISNVSLRTGSGGSDGRRRGLNEFAQLTYRASFTDGSVGVFLFTPDVRWRRMVGGDWDDADNWTLGIAPAHVHDVRIDPEVSLTVTGPGTDRTVRSLAVGGGAGAAALELQPGVQFTVLESLDVAQNGTISAPGVLEVGRVEIEGGGVVDLMAGEMVVRDGDPVVVNALVASGHAGGSWDGPGINSSVAAVEAGRALGVAVDGNDVVVRFTWGGDANLDEAVTIADLGVLAASWQQPDRLWFQGDFNYDGEVTIADLGILAGAWQQGVTGGSTMSFEEAMGMFDVFDGVVVPEPGAVGLVVLYGVLGMGRRRGFMAQG